jgi:predicted nucleic acid-binding protein
MGQYLIDTNVVSDYFFASMPRKGLQFMDNVIDAIPNLSIISQIELLCWKTDVVMERQIKNFIADSIIFNITPNVIAYCVDIRRNKKVKTPDAIIAATAMAHGYTLVTNNEKDFTNINGLKIINPFNL